MTPLVADAERFGGVFHHLQLEGSCARDQTIDVTRSAEQVDGDQGPHTTAGAFVEAARLAELAFFAQKGLDFRWIDLPCLGIGVDEDRRRLAVAHRVDRRHERDGRDQNLVTRLDAGRKHRHMKRRRAAGCRDRVIGADIVRNGFFKPLDERADR